MVYWRHDADKIFIDIIAPQGINPGYLQVYLIYPPSVIGNPNFSIIKEDVYKIDGSTLAINSKISHYP